MRKTLLALSLILLTISSEAATVYISDALTVPLRRGPSTGHKIIHAGLPSGMALEILGEDKAAGFRRSISWINPSPRIAWPSRIDASRH
jgi:hypothetical protein